MYKLIKEYIMNELGFSGGVNDAKNDLVEGWVPAGFNLDFIVSQLRSNMGATDSYVAGYLSVLFSE